MLPPYIVIARRKFILIIQLLYFLDNVSKIINNRDLSVSQDDFVASWPVEYYPPPGPPPQQVNSLTTIITEGPPKAFPPSQRFNEAFSFGPYPPGLSINTVATTNYGVAQPFPKAESIPEILTIPGEIESVTVIENYPPVTQTIQIPPKPPLPSYYTVSPPAPPPPTIIKEVTYTPTVVPEKVPQKVETEIITISSVPVEEKIETIPAHVPSQQLPVTLQINIPSLPEPVFSVISPPAPCPCPYSSFSPSYEMPPPPIIVMEKSKSSLKSILPILMLSLFDGGCGNSGGGGSCSCSQCSAPTPIPYPIMIPTSNPVITRGRGKGKGKSTNGTKGTDTQC